MSARIRRNPSTGSNEWRDAIQAYCFRRNYYQASAAACKRIRKALINIIQLHDPVVTKEYVGGVIYRATAVSPHPPGYAEKPLLKQFKQEEKRLLNNSKHYNSNEEKVVMDVPDDDADQPRPGKRPRKHPQPGQKASVEERQIIIDALIATPELTKRKHPTEYAALQQKLNIPEEQLYRRVPLQKRLLRLESSEFWPRDLYIDQRVRSIARRLRFVVGKHLISATWNDPNSKDWQSSESCRIANHWSPWGSFQRLNTVLDPKTWLNENVTKATHLAAAIYALFDRWYWQLIASTSSDESSIEAKLNDTAWNEHTDEGYQHFRTRIEKLNLKENPELFQQLFLYTEDQAQLPPIISELFSAVQEWDQQDQDTLGVRAVHTLRRLFLFSILVEHIGIDTLTQLIPALLLSALAEISNHLPDASGKKPRGSPFNDTFKLGLAWLNKFDGRTKQLMRLLGLTFIMCEGELLTQFFNEVGSTELIEDQVLEVQKYLLTDPHHHNLVHELLVTAFPQ